MNTRQPLYEKGLTCINCGANGLTIVGSENITVMACKRCGHTTRNGSYVKRFMIVETVYDKYNTQLYVYANYGMDNLMDISKWAKSITNKDKLYCQSISVALYGEHGITMPENGWGKLVENGYYEFYIVHPKKGISSMLSRARYILRKLRDPDA